MDTSLSLSISVLVNARRNYLRLMSLRLHSQCPTTLFCEVFKLALYQLAITEHFIGSFLHYHNEKAMKGQGNHQTPLIDQNLVADNGKHCIIKISIEKVAVLLLEAGVLSVEFTVYTFRDIKSVLRLSRVLEIHRF